MEPSEQPPSLPPPAQPPATTLTEYLLMGMGILLGLVGSILINVGNNTQAYGYAAEKLNEEKIRMLCCQLSPKVVSAIGTVVFVVGSVINFVAFVFAAASILAPLEAIQFVSNLIFARFVVGKEVTRKMVAGSLCIVAGTIGVVASGSKEVYSFTIPELRLLWQDPLWIGYVVAAWSTSLAMQAFWEVQMRRHKASGKKNQPQSRLMPVLYAVSSALIGTQSVVQAKAFSELMELWLSEGVVIWVEWFTYVVLGYFLVTVGF